MSGLSKRATIYFDPNIHRVLRIKSAETERSVSDLVNDAIKLSLAEDKIDLAAIKERSKEPEFAFEKILKELKRNGKI